MATKNPAGITPFKQFVTSLSDIKPAQHLAAAGSKALKADAVQAMAAHLGQQYDGVEAVHSFMDENGSVFDCIPIDQQPALREKTAAGVAKPITLPAATEPRGAAHTRKEADTRKTYRVTQLGAKREDQAGNRMQAPSGTIPMRRLTIQNLTKFKTLRNFFEKSPYGSATPPHANGAKPLSPRSKGAPSAAIQAVQATHRWAHAYQNVSNRGGHSFLNVWDPPIGPNQVFSLSQHWYVGGSGGGLQTAEVGWQVYPQMYGNTKPVFFIYWTADDYQTTGCYNLTCTAFVQTNGSWAIGGALSPSSTPGGRQFEIDVSFYLVNGNWWLYVGGGAAANAIGYYPTSLYRNGALASQAAEIDFGGEVVGTTSWPPMGSGAFANQGYQHAAYQRDVRYFPSGGGNVAASLTAAAASPACFTATVTSFNPPWNETLFFGGPGGNNC
jgi:neprosin-like protein